ncbi:uncharacterized protein FTOL_02525 [Fusarium torulosum]|uniref:Zn(2)-C6 fungal-type domain-containing protein n=1 Tax=Fusarium torulosum TaxID=33205 RepID=A0AAE8SER3_9HYPO|nr:uncharacterized protein FTOL_02525 [Fusarium torulosum]
MANYMEGLALGYGFNNANLSEGLDSAQQSTASPSSNTQQDTSSYTQPTTSFQGNVTVYQTTGPDAHTGPIQQPGSNAPALNPRSCVTCRRRKVRCDKQMPCSNCRRAQIPCVFPAPGRAPRQPRRKDPNAPTKNSSQREIELMKRLRKLEGIVEELSGQIEVESGGKDPSSASSPEAAHTGQNISFETSAPNPQRHLSNASSHHGNMGMVGDSPRGSDATSEHSEAARKNMHKKFGRLVLNDTGGSRRYVSHGFWSKLNDELDLIREETQRLTDEDFDDSEEETPDSSPAAALTANHNAFIFGYRTADVDLENQWPLPSHIPFLWSVYQDNVEPLLKVLHIPTMEPIFRDARKDRKQLSPANEALVWAIYYAAIMSLEPEEVQANLGINKRDVLVQYRFAVEQALAKANFLNSLDTTIIQAFLIFLFVVKGQDQSRFCWSLTGLVAHLAQGMGLHRDGSHFGLSPFETEMRRRLWWTLLLLDLRSADDLGTDLIIQEFNYDTQMPSNINDTDIKPDSAESPEPREGHSDCALALIRFEIAGFGRRLLRLSSASMSFCPNGMAYENTSLADRERMLIDVYERVEHKFLKHVTDDADPMYWVAASIARIIMAKMTLVIYQPALFPGSDSEGTLSEEARERAYLAAIEITEYNHILNSDSRCKQFKWLFKGYTNWSAMAYFLIASCRRPWTPLVERGWEALHGYDGHPALLPRTADLTAVVMPIRKLYVRAQRHRAAEITRLRSNPEEARRLEFEERNNPSYQTRFGQAADGAVNKMEEIRNNWKSLVRCDGSNIPISTPAEMSPVAPPAILQPTQPQAPSRPRTPLANDVPGSLDLSDTTMGYMNEIMSQDSSFPMMNFWPLNDVGSAQIKAMGTGATPIQAINQLPQQNTTQVGDIGQQFSLDTMQLPKDDNQAYIWNGPFPSVHPNYDGMGMDDVDMIGEDFNWHSWSQNVRGL